MTLYDKIASLRPVSGQLKWAGRIYAELHFSADASTANGGKFDALLSDVADYLLAAVKEDGAITKETVLRAEEMLAPIVPLCKSYTAHFVGHAHIDMNWMWGYNETASVTVDTFRTVLDLMKEYPEFTFAQSQASTYRIIEENAPEMIEEIKQRVKEGRWEVSASTWVENDKNMPSGESLARHILYTKRYLGKLLDIPAESMQMDFEPDTFGHNISVPEVCAKGGVKYYYHCRGREDSPCAYVWRSRAGHELLVYNEPSWYNTDIGTDNNWCYPQICKEISSHDYLIVYGVGDHGGGPTRRDIEHIKEMATWPAMCTVKFSTYAKFFAELEKSRKSLPVYEGEFNCTFTGCYTSQSRIKMANHIGEDRLYEAEFLASAANNLAGDIRRNEVLAKAWERVLFNQFHDILPGSGVMETREFAMGRFQEAMAAAQSTANNAMRAIAAKIDVSSIATDVDLESISEGAGVGYNVGQGAHFSLPVSGRGCGKKRIFHLFNSTQAAFEGIVHLTVWDWQYDPARAAFADENGNTAKFRFEKNGEWYWGHNFKQFAVYVKVPAFGYSTYTLTAAEIKDNIRRGHPTDRVDWFNDDVLVLENNRLKAVFEHGSMQLLSLTDKDTGRELIKKPSARFLFVTESTTHGMTSWRVGDRMKVENLNVEKAVTVWDKQGGECSQSIKYELAFGERSKLTVTVSLDDNARYLDFDVACDFHEVGDGKHTPQLSFEAPVSYGVNTYRYDVPFGVIDRKPVAHDVPANSFAAALPDGMKDQPAVVLMTDSKYGYRGFEDTLTVNLVRGSSDPDPYPEYGMHNIRIGLGVSPDASANTLFDFVAPFIHPVAVCCARKGDGKLPLSGKLFEADGVRVTAVKTAEDGEGLVLRVFETSGKVGLFTLKFARPVSKACETDINEQRVAPLKADGCTVFGSIGSDELKTILVKF